MANSKVLVIGLDGATWDLLNPLIEKGWLPNIAKLKREGAFGILESVFPPVTAPAWASFATGTNPGKHGCYDFVMPQGSLGNLRTVTSRDIKTETFYEVIEREGLRYILVNLPVSYPPRMSNSENVVITSLLTQGNDFVFPAQLIEQVPVLRQYRISPGSQITTEGTNDEYITDIRALERIRFECAKDLFQNREWDLFFYLISGTDWIQHRMFGALISGRIDQTNEAVQAYQDFDHCIGWFTQHLPDQANLLVISDHGFMVRQGMFYVNTWLWQEGYLSATEKPTLRVTPTPRAAARQMMSQRHKIRPPERIVEIIKYPPKGLRSFLERNPPLMKVVKYLYWKVAKKLLSLEPNWGVATADLANSKAYMTREGTWGIYINDRDRFQDGTVGSREEYECLRQELREKLSALRDPKTGDPIFDWVAFKEDIYNGDYVPDAPDILFESSTHQVDSILTRVTIKVAHHNGHSPYGLLLAWGPDIKKGEEVSGTSLMDLAPTILHLLRLPIVKDMDGKVLKALFKQNSEPFKASPKTVEPQYQRAAAVQGKQYDEAVEARLRALGYLD